MRNEFIHDALNHLDDDMIEEVDKLRNLKKKKFPWHRVTAIAASVCLLFIGGYAWENYLKPIGDGKFDDMSDQRPESAPSNDQDLNEGVSGADVEHETDRPPEPDVDNSTANSSAPTDSVCESEAKPGAPETTEPSEFDYYTALGDAYLLKDNYTKITMLPHKAWSEDASLEEVLSKSVEIESRDYEAFDRFIEALCDTPRIESRYVSAVTNPDADMVYHIFFHKADGTVVHVWMCDDLYVCYDADRDYCMQIDRTVYVNVFKRLATYW